MFCLLLCPAADTCAREGEVVSHVGHEPQWAERQRHACSRRVAALLRATWRLRRGVNAAVEHERVRRARAGRGTLIRGRPKLEQLPGAAAARAARRVLHAAKARGDGPQREVNDEQRVGNVPRGRARRRLARSTMGSENTPRQVWSIFGMEVATPAAL